MTSALDDPRFTLVPSGIFRERFGPLGPHSAHSRLKLCVAATDAELLIDLLYGVSLREDCFYVKYETRPHDGMYLGRCFLETDQAVSELCQELKGHPRLLVSLQDDAWLEQFRDPTAATRTAGVWDDFPEQEAEIMALLEATFGRPHEARAVAQIRATRAATISLVAQIAPGRGHARWPIVGYILLSRVAIGGSDEPRGLGIGQLAVAPAYQREGHGSALVSAALRRATRLGYAYVVVLGERSYYGRFGFVPAAELGLSYPEPALAPYFLAYELVPGALEKSRGIVRYRRSLVPPP